MQVIRELVADKREIHYQFKKRPLYFFSTFDAHNFEEGFEENKMIIDSTRYGMILILNYLIRFILNDNIAQKLV